VERHQRAVLGELGDEAVDQPRPSGRALRTVVKRFQFVQDPLADRVQAEVQLEQDVRLALEVVVERGLGRAQALGDVAQRGLVVAVLGEQLECDVEDPLARGRSRTGRARRPLFGSSPPWHIPTRDRFASPALTSSPMRRW
jgi:hypothetical protein